ncbi:hypothetical protein [Arthrobacter sp. H41]|uniref:hypothetical protein n=1 Tax=Arthrobacter sp. H41 TaxID=1312978 RepID=UPI0004AF44A6|nr:hypothetical protein [Arthrobacter sp. H41]
MAAVLTTGSTLVCPHGGTVTLGAGQSKLKVNGKSVLVQADVMGASVSGCGTPTVTAPPPTKPCTLVTSVLTGPTPKLTVGGQPVLLDNAQGLTDGLAPAPGTWRVQSAGQNRAVVS